MKRGMLLWETVGVVLGLISVLQAAEIHPAKMRVSLLSSGLTSVSGKFGPGINTRDVLQTGSSFGAAWEYFPTHDFGIQAQYGFGSMRFDRRYRPTAAETPHFIVQQIRLDGIYNFANLVGSASRLRPYVNAGARIYPLRVTENGVSGKSETLPDGQKFSETKFGLNGGVGLEVLASDHLAVFGGSSFDYIFAKDSAKFGADFGNQGTLNFGIGLSYNLSHNL